MVSTTRLESPSVTVTARELTDTTAAIAVVAAARHKTANSRERTTRHTPAPIRFHCSIVASFLPTGTLLFCTNFGNLCKEAHFSAEPGILGGFAAIRLRTGAAHTPTGKTFRSGVPENTPTGRLPVRCRVCVRWTYTKCGNGDQSGSCAIIRRQIRNVKRRSMGGFLDGFHKNDGDFRHRDPNGTVGLPLTPTGIFLFIR